MKLNHEEDYEKSFIKAIERTNKLNIENNKFEINKDFIVDLELINNLALKIIELRDKYNIPRQITISDCGGMSFGLQQLLLENNIPSLITIGDVVEIGKARYKTTVQSLKNELEKGVSNDQVYLHVWLTLPNMHIIDTTLLLKSQKNKFINKKLDYIKDGLYSKVKINNRAIFKPMIVGSNFLYKIGLLR